MLKATAILFASNEAMDHSAFHAPVILKTLGIRLVGLLSHVLQAQKSCFLFLYRKHDFGARYL